MVLPSNFASGPNATYFVQVNPTTLFIEVMYGTSDGKPMDPSHIQVPAGISWNYDAQQLQATRDTSGNIVISRK